MVLVVHFALFSEARVVVRLRGNQKADLQHRRTVFAFVGNEPDETVCLHPDRL